MTGDDAGSFEDLYASFMAAYDEALAGRSPPDPADPEAPAELRSQMEGDLACLRLLRQHWPRSEPASDAGTPVEQPASSGVASEAATGLLAEASAADADDVPAQLGRFQIRRELGRGSFGRVFLAFDPRLGREVALKVPRGDVLASPELRERFQREARAAAGLDHPGIVPVYEAGAIDQLAYIASAYCPGPTLAAWLKQQTEAVPSQFAAELLASLADAVQHAHARGVLHRDLKPSNILLQRKSEIRNPKSEIREDSNFKFHISDLEPKVTDFGLAKRLEGTECGSQTGSEAILGTPNYMAPEQASGQSKTVGPAADVYALGAILYELLTGRPPFQGEMVLDTLEQVRSREPVPPSRLRPRLPRDLQTICLKCLTKQPARRYASAAALADDLRRFLNGEPIRARPVSAGERWWRWCRRNPWVAGLTAALVAALIGGLVTALGLWQQADEQRRQADEQRLRAEAQWRRAEEQREQADQGRRQAEAQRRRSELEAAKTGWLHAVLAGQDDDPLALAGRSFVARTAGEHLTVRAILERGRARVKKLEGQWEIQATVLDALGDAYRTLGMYPEAETLLRDAFQLRRERLGAADPVVAASLYSLGTLYHDWGAFDAARPRYEQALAIYRRQPAPDPMQVCLSVFALAWLCVDMEDFATAERLLQEVRQLPLSPDDRAVALARADLALAGLAADQEQYTRALFLTLPAMRELLRRERDAPLMEAMDLFEKGALEVAILGRYQAAKDTLRKCRDCCRRTLPPHHFYEVFILNFLAQAQEKLGEDDAAEKCYREALEIARKRVGPEAPRTVVFLTSLARLLQHCHRRPEADQLFDEFVAAERARFGPNHFLTANALTIHASKLAEWEEDAPRQERLAREALEIYRKTGGPARKLYAVCTLTLARAYLHQGKAQEAETLLHDSLPLVRQRYGPKHVQVASVLTELALALLAQGKQAEGRELLPESLAIDRKGTESRLGAVGRIYRDAHRPEQAAAVALARRQLWPNDPNRLVQAARELALCVPAGSADLAERCAGEAVRTLRQAVIQGYRAVGRLQTDTAFAPLRKRPDYQRIMDTLEGKGEPVELEKVREE